MQRPGFALITLLVFGGTALGLPGLTAASNLPEQKIHSPASSPPNAAMHETRAGEQEMIQFPNANKITPRIKIVSWSPPTRGSFMATWASLSGAKGYSLDVSTGNSFSSYVEGYHDLDVGNVNGQVVTGLNPGTTYHYRVRPYAGASSGEYSNVMTATTEAPTGLIINPTFDDSIINDPNSAAIEAMINQAIAIYESLFSDPITIQILFRYSTTAPNGDPLPEGVVAQSFSVTYTLLWNDFISVLRADARTGNDNIAIASLPGSALSTNITPSSGNGRALGLNTPPAMFPDGTIGQSGPYDGIVTLNSALLFSFTRPPISGSFDAQRSVEHEIDEVIGLGSYLNTSSAPAPCPSYEAESSDNTLTGGAVVQSCPTCSGGADVGYVGNNSGTLQFNHVSPITPGTQTVTIWYTNGDAVRYALLSVNGSQGTPLGFPSTGSFQTVGSIQTTITLNAGSNNTLEFYNPIVGSWAPDFDRVEVNCVIPPPTDLRPQDLFSWSSPGVRNLITDGSRYFSIDSGNTNIVDFNQNSPGDFGDWLSEACPQFHPYVQNAFACRDQYSDVSATSPEGINLDVIGYDLATAATPTPTPTPAPITTPASTPIARAVVADFNNDSHPDLVIQNTVTHETVVGYFDDVLVIGAAFGPTLPSGWRLVDAADFDGDGQTDYVLLNPAAGQTVIAYLSGMTVVGAAYGPPVPLGWELVRATDFNGDAYPDYVLYNASTGETMISYLNNTVVVGAVFGPTLPTGWNLIDVADFDSDGNPDYALFDSGTGQTVIGYLSGPTVIGAAFGPTLPRTWPLVATADLDGDGHPDYVLYNATSGQTAIGYLNNTVVVNAAIGPILPAGWSLVGQ